MRTTAVHLDIEPEKAWRLYARPDQWPRWAPYMLGAWRLEGIGGEVRKGARGVMWLLGAPLPVKVLRVQRGRRWTSRIGPVRFEHTVEPSEHGGCVVALSMLAPPGLESALSVYGPVATAALRRMGRVAAEDGNGPPQAAG